MDYKEKLERAKELYPTANADQKYVLECLFPELAENRDERILEIIKHCIESRYLHTSTIKGISQKECFAWLEKQSEQKSIDICCSSIINDKEFPASEKRNFRYFIKPKFHEGDWILDNKSGITQQVLDFRGGTYTCTYNSFTTDCESNYHLWTIKDAKDGDVLVSQYNKPFIYNGNYSSFRIGSYCGIAIDNTFRIACGKCNWTDAVNIHPATKEQRDTLFIKMKEADYEWSAELKKVRKLPTLTDVDDDDTVRVVGSL